MVFDRFKEWFASRHDSDVAERAVYGPGHGDGWMTRGGAPSDEELYGHTREMFDGRTAADHRNERNQALYDHDFNAHKAIDRIVNANRDDRIMRGDYEPLTRNEEGQVRHYVIQKHRHEAIKEWKREMGISDASYRGPDMPRMNMPRPLDLTREPYGQTRERER